MPREAWIALAVATVSAISLWDLLRTPATGAFVTTTTFPIALVGTLLALALLLLIGSLWRRTAPPRKVDDPPPPKAAARVATLFGLSVAYVAALPWTGYLLSSALFFGALSLLFLNRRPLTIIGAMIVVPLALVLFFEKYMIVLLPSSRLFG